MASGFSSVEETVCEEADCDAITDVTFYVKEKKRLCRDCALKKDCIGTERRGGLDIYCEKHDKLMDLYCKTHGVPICFSCAMIDHRQQQCVHCEIEEALKEKKAQLSGLKDKLIEKLELIGFRGCEIRQCIQDTDEHLQTVKKEVDTVIEKAVKRDTDREKEDADEIDQEIDGINQKLQNMIQEIQDEIQKNNQRKEMRHTENHAKAVERRKLIYDKQSILHTDVQNIAQEIERKIGEIEQSLQEAREETEKAKQTLDTVLEDDKNILKDGHCLNASLGEELKKPLIGREVKEINDVVSGVRFVKGVGSEKYDGRIDGYDGEWKLNVVINVSAITPFPRIVGCIDEFKLVITNGISGATHTYTLDLNTKGIQRVVNKNDISWICSCAVLNDEKIVCGKYIKGCKGDSLPRSISVYDREWRHINDVTVPRNTKLNTTWVYNVAADQDGMIITAEGGQPKIYVINPADGEIINTITCKENIVMYDVLSSNHIIARPSASRVLIIDREGNHIGEIPHSGVILNGCVDHMTDDLYVVTSDGEYKTCVIDHVKSEAGTEKKRVISFPLSTRVADRFNYICLSRVVMTSSGKMIAGDGDNILVFKKMLSL